MSVGALPRDRFGRPVSRARSARSRALPVALAVAGLTIAAAVLRFYHLGHQGFWFDEANTAQLVRFAPGKMLGLIPQSESTPPLYYGLAWIWARVFGDSEAGLRSLSAVAGVLVVPAAYAAARRLLSPRAGLIVAALTACSPLLIWYSQEARSYELLVLLTALSLAAFASVRDAPSARNVTVWVIASALALATHYYAVVAIVPQAAWLLAEHRRERVVQVGVGIVALCGIALIPLAISQNGTGNDRWIASAPFEQRLHQIAPQFLIGTNSPHRVPVKYVAMAGVLVALGLLVVSGLSGEAPAPSLRRRRWGEPAGRRGGALLAAGLAIAGFLLALVLTLAGFDDLITRNVIALWLPAAIVVGAGLAAGRGGRGQMLGVALTLVLCATGVYATIGIASERNMQRPDWRYVARALGPGPPGGRAILVQHYGHLLPLSLYLRHLQVMRRPERVSEIDVISMVSPQQPLCWWGAACNLLPSRMQRRYDLQGFHALERRHVLQWTILRLTAGHAVTLTRDDLSRALHTTRLDRDELIFQPGRAP